LDKIIHAGQQMEQKPASSSIVSHLSLNETKSITVFAIEFGRNRCLHKLSLMTMGGIVLEL